MALRFAGSSRKSLLYPTPALFEIERTCVGDNAAPFLSKNSKVTVPPAWAWPLSLNASQMSIDTLRTRIPGKARRLSRDLSFWRIFENRGKRSLFSEPPDRGVGLFLFSMPKT